MRDQYYRTGQAAAEWGVSQHHVRRLCEAGLVEAEQTPSGQFRIPVAEVERWKKAGRLPEIPHAAEPENHSQPKPRGSGLLAQPSPDVQRSAEAVLKDHHELERLQIAKERTEIGDYFAERRRRRQEQDQRQAEQQAQAQAAAKRRTWLDHWIECALDSLPYDAPREIRPDVQLAVEEALSRCRPDQPAGIIRPIVEGAVERVLAPLKRHKETEGAIELACGELPWDAQRDPKNWGRASRWKSQARRDAAVAVAALPAGANHQQKLGAARAAVQNVARDFEHEKKCQAILSGISLPGATDQETDEARDAVQEALAGLPAGTSEAKLRRAAEQALAPLEEAASRRRDQERRRRHEEEQQQQENQAALLRQLQAPPPSPTSDLVGDLMAQLVEQLDPTLTHVDRCLEQVEREGRIEYADDADRANFARRIKSQLRKILRPQMSPQEVQDLIEDHLDAAIRELDSTGED